MDPKIHTNKQQHQAGNIPSPKKEVTREQLARAELINELGKVINDSGSNIQGWLRSRKKMKASKNPPNPSQSNKTNAFAARAFVQIGKFSSPQKSGG